MRHQTEDILDAISVLWDGFFKCRSHFPMVKRDVIGSKIIPIEPYYVRGGHSVTIVFDFPIDDEMYDQMLAIGHWLNQNFIVRLCATLESFQVISTNPKIRINHDLEGAKYVEIVRRLRHRIAHSSGRFNPDKKDDRKTLEVMNEMLNRDYKVDGRNSWPLAIDFVLIPLRDGCIEYIKNKYDSA